MIVTPGYTFNNTESVTHTKLNALGVPAIALEAADVEAFLPDGSNPNYLRNGNFAKTMWQRGTSQVSCPVNTITYRADYWGVKPAEVLSAGLPTPATVKYEMGATGPSARPKSLHALKLTGDSTGAAIAAVDVLQDIAAHLSTALRAAVVVTVYVYNNSGAAFTPTLYFDTADAEDNFSAVTNRTSAAGTSCANATWTLQTFTADLTSATNMTNGLRVRLRLPSPALSDAAKSVQLSQFKLEIGAAATGFQVERDEVAEDLGAGDTGGVPLNYFENPTFGDETWLATSVTLTENLAMGGGPRGWLARAAGATGAVLDRHVDANIPCPRLTGAATVSTVDFIQDIPRSVAALLGGRTMTVSLKLYNATGAAFTPTLYIDSCDGENTHEDVTNRKTQLLSECPSGGWTSLSHTFDPDDLTDYDNGLRLYVRIPSGSLDSDSKTVFFKELQFVDGATVPAWTPPRERVEPCIAGQTRGLAITSTGGATWGVTVEEAVLRDASGRALLIRVSSALTLDAAASGAGGLDTGSIANAMYHFWLISNGIAHNVIMSLSATAPTMPAGYTYKARVGAHGRIAGNWVAYVQRDDVVNIFPTFIKSGSGPAVANTWETLDCSAVLPPVAREVWGFMGMTTNAAGNVGISANGYGGEGHQFLNSSGQTAWTPSGLSVAQGAVAPFRLGTDGSASLNWISSATTANKCVAITGYRL